MIAYVRFTLHTQPPCLSPFDEPHDVIMRREDFTNHVVLDMTIDSLEASLPENVRYIRDSIAAYSITHT